jgi:4-hydroxyphenylpyruvate dioxygenase-like putative hemolysin
MSQTLLADDLTASDRCDRCGAQAFVRVVLAAGELLFCAHHARAHGERLAQVAVEVQDGTAAINAKPSPAAY